jgi:hypothetical protein
LKVPVNVIEVAPAVGPVVGEMLVITVDDRVASVAKFDNDRSSTVEDVTESRGSVIVTVIVSPPSITESIKGSALLRRYCRVDTAVDKEASVPVRVSVRENTDGEPVVKLTPADEGRDSAEFDESTDNEIVEISEGAVSLSKREKPVRESCWVTGTLIIGESFTAVTVMGISFVTAAVVGSD